MNDLSNNVSDYYFANLEELPFDKQFHFASRLFLWNQDPRAKALLDQYRAEFTANDDPGEALRQVAEYATLTQTHGSKNAAELRRPYFEKYPTLKASVSLLFRYTFMKQLYGMDARDDLFTLCDNQAMGQLARQLLEDPEAISILSTHAINFLYLYRRVALQDETNLPLDLFATIGETAYDLSNKVHLQLLIYLYTHCIIGETKFYYRSIPTKNLATYTNMMQKLEALIEENFADINLDNKFEFLVCAKIVGFTSKLESKIFDEAAISVSDDGTFLVDKHNNNPQTTNSTLDKSEHRNVLFIMANSNYTPLT